MLTLAFAAAGRPAPAVGGTPTSVWTDSAGRLIAQAFPAASSVYLVWQDLGTFEFSRRADRQLVVAWPAPDVELETLTDMFARVVQPVILQSQGWQALHASAVAAPDGAVVFCGVGHSGKSTFAYAASLISGCEQIADDAVVLDCEPPLPEVVRLPYRPKLRNPSYSYFRSRAATDPHAPVPLTGSGASIPLRAIIVLRQRSDRTTQPLVRLAPTLAFPELLRHAHCFDDRDPFHTRPLMEAYLRIASSVPVFALDYQPNLNELTALVCDTLVAAGIATAALP